MNERNNNPLPTDDAGFDHLLRSALLARGEPEAPFNLAGRAIALARTEHAARTRLQGQRIARQRRFALISGLAATVMIAALVAVAAERLWSRGDIAAVVAYVTSDSSSTTATATSSDSDSTSSTTSNTGTVAVIFVGELLVLSMILMTISRGASPSPWGAEAVAGMW